MAFSLGEARKAGIPAGEQFRPQSDILLLDEFLKNFSGRSIAVGNERCSHHIRR
jgi:hypothetical protein